MITQDASGETEVLRTMANASIASEVVSDGLLMRSSFYVCDDFLRTSQLSCL